VLVRVPGGRPEGRAVLSDVEALHITNTYKNSYPSFTAGIDNQIDIPGYGLLNGGLNWDHLLGHDNPQFNGYVKNATNKEYVQGRFDFYEQAGFVSSQYGQPRTFGFELRYTF